MMRKNNLQKINTLKWYGANPDGDNDEGERVNKKQVWNMLRVLW